MSEAIAAITAKCACVRLDAFDCARARYPRLACDDGDEDDVPRECEPCECPCHDELRDVLGGDDDE